MLNQPEVFNAELGDIVIGLNEHTERQPNDYTGIVESPLGAIPWQEGYEAGLMNMPFGTNPYLGVDAQAWEEGRQWGRKNAGYTQ